MRGISIFNNKNADNIQVKTEISLTFPDINFKRVKDKTPKVIPSAML